MCGLCIQGTTTWVAMTPLSGPGMFLHGHQAWLSLESQGNFQTSHRGRQLHSPSGRLGDAGERGETGLALTFQTFQTKGPSLVKSLPGLKAGYHDPSLSQTLRGHLQSPLFQLYVCLEFTCVQVHMCIYGSQRIVCCVFLWVMKQGFLLAWSSPNMPGWLLPWICLSSLPQHINMPNFGVCVCCRAGEPVGVCSLLLPC